MAQLLKWMRCILTSLCNHHNINAILSLNVLPSSGDLVVMFVMNCETKKLDLSFFQSLMKTFGFIWLYKFTICSSLINLHSCAFTNIIIFFCLMRKILERKVIYWSCRKMKMVYWFTLHIGNLFMCSTQPMMLEYLLCIVNWLCIYLFFMCRKWLHV